MYSYSSSFGGLNDKWLSHGCGYLYKHGTKIDKLLTNISCIAHACQQAAAAADHDLSGMTRTF